MARYSRLNRIGRALVCQPRKLRPAGECPPVDGQCLPGRVSCAGGVGHQRGPVAAKTSEQSHTSRVFHEVLEVGNSDEHINSINADGLAFAAIRGLEAELEDRDERLEEQNARIDDLEAENADLRDRLADIEARLGEDGTGGASPMPADD